MRVTLLGHASVLVEMDGLTCLMDPVFGDPFEEGVVASCPRRAVHVERLPRIDALILSHGHLDHFDIPSLARISRDCQVLCPKDPAIVYALKALGFTKINDAAPMTHLAFPGYELLTTHSNVTNVVEFGVVFKDKSGTFWNQVDTILAPETIAGTRKQCGSIDLLFAMHASQNFGFFEGKSAEFPFAMHQMNLNSVLSIRPKMVVPGAAGFRFCGGAEWCNAFLFPMSRERFLADLGRVDPSLEGRVANPGDVFEIQAGVVRHLPASSPCATMLEDDTALLRFDPTAPVPALVDPNPDAYPQVRMELAVDTCLTELTEFLATAYASGDAVVAELRQHRATYGIGVVYPDGVERRYRFTFGDAPPRMETGDAAWAPADMVHRIAASALTAWLAREKTYFYLRAFSRKVSTLYALEPADGRVTLAPSKVSDLLGYWLDKKMQSGEMSMKRWLNLQLKPHLRA